MNRFAFGALCWLNILLLPAVAGATDTSPSPRRKSSSTTTAAEVRPAPAPRPVAPAESAYLDGYVLGADGLALPGVTARVAGRPHLVVSNADGMFRLPLPTTTRQPLRIICSYAGLADCEVVLAPHQRVLSLEMMEATRLLSVERGH